MFGADQWLPSARLLRARVHPLHEEEAAHIIDGVGQPDRHNGPGDADSSDELLCLGFHISNGMLDTRSDERACYLLVGTGAPQGWKARLLANYPYLLVFLSKTRRYG